MSADAKWDALTFSMSLFGDARPGSFALVPPLDWYAFAAHMQARIDRMPVPADITEYGPGADWQYIKVLTSKGAIYLVADPAVPAGAIEWKHREGA